MRYVVATGAPRVHCPVCARGGSPSLKRRARGVSGVIHVPTKYPDVLSNLPVVQLDQLLGLFRLPIGLESEGLRIKLQDMLELTRCALRKESCCVFHGSHCDNWVSTNGRRGAAPAPPCTIHVLVAPPHNSLSLSFSLSFLFYPRRAVSCFLSFSLSLSRSLPRAPLLPRAAPATGEDRPREKSYFTLWLVRILSVSPAAVIRDTRVGRVHDPRVHSTGGSLPAPRTREREREGERHDGYRRWHACKSRLRCQCGVSLSFTRSVSFSLPVSLLFLAVFRFPPSKDTSSSLLCSHQDW